MSTYMCIVQNMLPDDRIKLHIKVSAIANKLSQTSR